MPKRAYKGLLSQPMYLLPHSQSPAARCSPPTELSSEDLGDGRRVFGPQAFGRRVIALFEHYEVNPMLPGAGRVLLLKLLKRHERASFDRGPEGIISVFDKHGVNPDTPGADLEVAIKVAVQHVPGFKTVESKPAACRLSPVDLVLLIIGIACVDDHLRKSGKKPTNRRIAEILSDPKQRSQIVGSNDGLGSVLAQSGNNGRTNDGVISKETIRLSYLPQIRSAEHDYKAGCATGFQYRLIDEAMPLIWEMNQREA